MDVGIGFESGDDNNVHEKENVDHKTLLVEQKGLRYQKNYESNIIGKLNRSNNNGATRSSDRRLSSPFHLVRRKSLKHSFMGNGISHEQLKDIYSSCIRLSSENKINIKNAFGLQLIDYMQELIKNENKSNSSTNFQVAGCTLDASVKIYSYRVDSVHNDAMKIAGSLAGKNENLLESDRDDDGDDIDRDENGLPLLKDCDGKSYRRSKRKNTNRNLRSKIEKNLKNITMESPNSFEGLENCGHSYDTSMNFGRVDSNPIQSLLMNNTTANSDCCFYSVFPLDKVFIKSKIPIWEKENRDVDEKFKNRFCNNCTNLLHYIDQFNFDEWVKPNLDSSYIDDIHILTGITQHDFDQQSIDNFPNLSQNLDLSIQNELNSDQAVNTFNYDASFLESDHNEDAIGEPKHTNPTGLCDIQKETVGGRAVDKTSFINFEIPNDSAVKINVDSENRQLNELIDVQNFSSSVPLNMTGGIALELSLEPGEYSYFKNLNNNKLRKLVLPNNWTGPDHWKYFTQSILKNCDQTTLDKIKITRISDEDKGTNKRKRKLPNPKFSMVSLIEKVDFLSPVSELHEMKQLKTGKAASTYSKSTVSTSNYNSTTLPETESCNIQELFKLFLMPMIKLYHTNEENQTDDTDMRIVTLHDNQTIYDYGNENDQNNYCCQKNETADEPDNLFIMNEDSVLSTQISPYKTGLNFKNILGDTRAGFSQKNKIEYAKYAKRFDTKQIKNTIWKILNVEKNPEIERQSNEECNIASEPYKGNESASFSNLYGSLVKELPKKSSENISVPIAFVCLLHLANEKSLTLESSEFSDDIKIKL